MGLHEGEAWEAGGPLTDLLIAQLKDVLTVRNLAHETHLNTEQVRIIDDLTEQYLLSILPRPKE